MLSLAGNVLLGFLNSPRFSFFQTVLKYPSLRMGCLTELHSCLFYLLCDCLSPLTQIYWLFGGVERRVCNCPGRRSKEMGEERWWDKHVCFCSGSPFVFSHGNATPTIALIQLSESLSFCWIRYRHFGLYWLAFSFLCLYKDIQCLGIIFFLFQLQPIYFIA